MFTNNVTVQIVDTSKGAPDYKKAGDTTILKMTNCVIVGKGMESGAPSVDLQLEDEKGNKFVVMTTGLIIEMLGGAVVGKRMRDERNKGNKNIN